MSPKMQSWCCNPSEDSILDPIPRDTHFRGRSIITGQWRYGHLVTDGVHFYIFNSRHFIPTNRADFPRHEVDPSTVGQYTGLRDHHSNMLYEGDYVTVTHKQPILNGPSTPTSAQVEWNAALGAWCLRMFGTPGQLPLGEWLKEDVDIEKII